MNPPEPGSDTERRVDQRYQVTCRVELVSGGSTSAEVEVSDLSAGGCFVECAEAVREGDLVKLRFRVRGLGDLTVWGEVVFHDGGRGFGLRFSAFSHGGGCDLLAVILAGEGRRD
jgi:hypothetical protein